MHNFSKELARVFIRNFIRVIEDFCYTADVGFGLLHHRHVQKHRRLT